MSIILTLLLIAAGCYGVIVVLAYLFQGHLLFFPNAPNRELRARPDRIGLAYEDVEIETADGVRLDAWFLPAESPRGTVLFFHGNAGNMGDRLDSLRIFNMLNVSVLIFDYRGYGRSTGKPSEAGLYADADAAWAYLTQTRGLAPDSIVLFGRSLGAAVAASLASRTEPAGLILESGFTSVPKLASELYPFLPVKALARLKFPTEAFVKKSAGRVLVAHSPDDEIIGFAHGQALFEAAREPKRFLKMSGSHNDGFLLTGQPYRDTFDAFFEEALNRVEEKGAKMR